MHKFLKLSAVSMLAVMVASNANAAGYTCEELIEYTSCNPGYYLDTSGAECPDGYTYFADMCEDLGQQIFSMPREKCEVENGDGELWGTYIGNVCVTTEWMNWYNEGSSNPSYSEPSLDYVSPVSDEVATTCFVCPDGYTCAGGVAQPTVTLCQPGYSMQPLCEPGGSFYARGEYDSEDLSFHESFSDDATYKNVCVYGDGEVFAAGIKPALLSGPTCGKCPAGYLCAGGDAAAVTCPAGSYCATAGLSQPTGKCNIGTYSIGGATAATCTSCPVTGLTDKDGKAVVATTVSTGSTSASACFVGDNVEFKNDKGIWHYKNTCSYTSYLLSSDDPNTAEMCDTLGGVWYDGDNGVYPMSCYGIPGDTDLLRNLIVYDDASDECISVAGSGVETYELMLEESDGAVSYNGEYCVCDGYWEYDDRAPGLYCNASSDDIH